MWQVEFGIYTSHPHHYIWRMAKADREREAKISACGIKDCVAATAHL